MTLLNGKVVNARMNNALERHRAPFSLKEVMSELNLSINELVDFVTWANISTAVPIPPNRTVRIFYVNKNFSFSPQNYQTSESEFQVDYLQIENLILKTIAAGGKKSISRFESMILSTGQFVSTKALHSRIYSCFLKQSEGMGLISACRKERIEDFYNSFIGLNSQKKWFGITALPNHTNIPFPRQVNWFRPPGLGALDDAIGVPRRSLAGHVKHLADAAANMHQGSLHDFFQFNMSDSLPPSEISFETIWVDKKDILFFPSEIYDLRGIIEALPSRGTDQKNPSKLDVLNSASEKFKTQISSIKDPSRYWRDNKNSSEIVRYLAEKLKVNDIKSLEYHIRVLVNDDNLFQDKKIEIAPKKDKYPACFSRALILLNEAGDPELLSMFDARLTRYKRIETMLDKLGFKPRAANNLKAILNGQLITQP